MSVGREMVKSVLRHSGVLDPVRKVRDQVDSLLHPPQVTRNQGQCWFVNSPEFHSRVYVYNYWVENYKIPHPVLLYTLIDDAGRVAAQGSMNLVEEQTAVLDSQELSKRHRLAQPFDGILLVELEHNNLVPRRVLQFNVDYLYNGGSITSVHGQGPLHPDSAFFCHDRMRVPAAEGLRTWCMLLSHSQTDRNSPYAVWLRNWKGERKLVERLDLPYRKHRRIEITDGTATTLAFLEGRDGALEVECDIDPQRVLVMVEDMRHGRRICNHSTNMAALGAPLIPVAERLERGYGPIIPTSLFVEEGRYTRYAFQNSYSEASPITLQVRILDMEGKPVGAPVAVHLKARGSQTMTAQELLEAAGAPQERFRGSIIVEQLPEDQPLTSVLDVVMEVVVDDCWAGVLTGGMYYNSPPSPVKRAKLFSRTLFSDEYRSELWLGHPTNLPESTEPSQTRIMLFDQTGSQRREVLVSIPANGALFAKMDELFPDIREVLGPAGIGQVKVRDVTTQLNGYHFVRHLPSGTIALDHLYGG